MQHTRVKSIIRIMSLIAILVMMAISLLVYKAPFVPIIIFIIFILVYVQLPGMYLLRHFGVQPEHISTQLTLGLFTGWSLDVLLYFVSDPLPGDFLLYASGPVLTLLLLCELFKGTGKSHDKSDRHISGTNLHGLLIHKFRFSRLSSAFCLFAALSFLYILLKTQYVYLAPEASSYIYMNPDKAYHMGLINSLASDYPLQSPWIQGRYIKYHIFTEVLYSLPLRLFGLSSDVILVTCGPLLTMFAVCLSLYSMFIEFCSRKERAGLYSILVLLSNIFIARGPERSIALLFLFKNENAAGFGVAAAIAAIIMLRYWYSDREKNKHSVRSFVILLAIVMLATGIKGPSGAVIIAAIWGTYLLGLILRKVRPSVIIPILVLTAGFALVYATILGMKGQGNGSGDSVIALATISNICFWKAPLIAFMKSVGIPGIIRLAIVLIVFMMFMLTAYFLPFCFGYIHELWLVLTGKKEYDFAAVSVYASAMVGTAAMMVLNYSGHSQIYFGLIAVFFAPVIACRYLEDLEESRDAGIGSGRLLRSLKTVFTACIILTTVSIGVSYYNNLGEAIDHANPDKTYNQYLSITNDEYQAMRWIEENTPEDSLLATDRYYSVAPEDYSYENRWSNRFFLYAVYADRFCYIAGSGYNLGAGEWEIRQEMIETNEELYDSDNDDRGELARALDVDYVVVSRRFTDAGDLSNEDYDLCFSNNDVDIYRIEEN